MYRRSTPTVLPRSSTYLRLFSAALVKVTFCSYLALLNRNWSLIKDQHSCCSRGVEWSEWRCCLNRWKWLNNHLEFPHFTSFLSVAFFFCFILLAQETETCWTTTPLLQPPMSWGNLLFHCLLACNMLNTTFPSADITGVASPIFDLFAY